MQSEQSEHPENRNQEQVSASEEKYFSLKGIWETISDPEKFFLQLKDNPKILVPYLFYVLIVFSFFYLTLDLLYELQMKIVGAREGLEAADISPKQMKSIILVQTTVMLSLMPLIAAGLGLFWGNFIFAGKASFKQVLSVTLYGSTIYAYGMLMLTPLMFANDTFRASYSLAAFVPGSAIDSFTYVFLSKFSLFIIWELAVIGIGLSIIYNIPRNKGYMLSVLSMGMLSIIHVISTAIKELLF